LPFKAGHLYNYITYICIKTLGCAVVRDIVTWVNSVWKTICTIKSILCTAMR